MVAERGLIAAFDKADSEGGVTNHIRTKQQRPLQNSLAQLM